MSLKDIKIQSEYRSLLDDVIEEFYNPLLNESILYRRAVGFFSSSSLHEMVEGIGTLVENGGKIQIISSPKLSEEDIRSINEGLVLKEKRIEECMTKEIDKFCNVEDEDHVNLLVYLIANSILEIKIAVCDNAMDIGMYHEKMGIFEDAEGNQVAFAGSMNESMNAYKNNYESIDVFTSWGIEQNRVIMKREAFQRLWNNSEQNISVYSFPDAAKKHLLSYRTEKEVNINIAKSKEQQKKCRNIPMLPEKFSLREYQQRAIDKWMEQKSCGIFDMATGTGKTYTGLGAVVSLANHLNNKLAVIIVCPLQHLVEQWVDDIVKFNINPIIGYSASEQKDWKQRLDNAIRDQKLKVAGSEFFCFITTNKTFSSEFVQSKLKRIKGEICIVVDEAHNIGAKTYAALLDKQLYKYRLALSATLDRFNDAEGTRALYDFFGSKCIEYTLEEAIEQGKLTKYKYYPVLVYLNEDELEDYRNITYEMGQNLIKGKNGKLKLNKHGEMLAIERARLVAGAKGKISALYENIYKYKDKNYLLVYCGATTVNGDDNDILDIDESEVRQIDLVTKMLGNDLDMKVAQFTSKESVKDRKKIKDEFAKGKELQALVAIKCLDEGVDIPDIRTAFILASTTNPKEYIQRRGRVLRLAKGKEFSEIYDFITLPRPLDEVSTLTEQQIKREISLVKNELKRMIEFSKISLNELYSYDFIGEIAEAYNINLEELEDYNYDD